ncbi:HNH endonuclease signature motif containing protein [[Mycobacterium] burgundiense]|uniref:DUF222 domain-containing protein n=1 Tax=[Mycobacterium] burgundiense TaxID=3064286 RepID=A0ABM9LYS4_9MYCO|nr:HNH endonuclease signature motif containing protein [Mycolicibacterium sp. MU0053]CAJ1507041.1 DUF222 domain-containing protein [Mycolicibacterium sp. MU0053]
MCESGFDPDDDTAVITAITDAARAEAAAAARRLAAIHALMDLRLLDDDERELWACDPWDAAAAEIGAALGLSQRRASGQMYLARAMHTRLPRVFALLTAGAVSARTASTIAWRTHLVIDDDALAAIDSAIADQAVHWGPLSDAKLDLAIDKVLAEHDPDAVRAFEAAARGRDVQFGKPEDDTGTSSMWGRLYSTDAALIKKRLVELTRHLCAGDPRSAGERRVDALGAMAAESGPLACRCGNSGCAGATVKPSRSPAVIHVLADERAITAARTGISKDATQTAAPAPVRQPAAVLQGGGIVPQPLLQELLLNGARVKPLTAPPTHPEPGYRPSAALAAFVRARDMFCRFPGCSTPAQFCDIDHVIPYPVGPTHPSDLRCLCRKNHLLKTFWTGEQGWSDVQHPDGTIVWTSPTGHTYTTHPGSRLVFPDWDVTTATLTLAASGSASTPNRGLQMPRRTRTRGAERAQRMKSARAQRDTS